MRWRRWRSEQDFEEEIRSHLAHEADRLVEQGLSREEAEAAARRAFGSELEARAQFRGTQPGPFLENLVKDVTLAFRSLRREPWFAASAVLTLALAIGLNTAIFSVLYGLALRPLPLPRADRLVTVHQLFQGVPPASGFGDASIGGVGGRTRRINGSTDMVSYAEYAAYRAGGAALSGLAAYAPIGLTVEGASPFPVSGLLVTCDYFGVLGATMQAGRGFVNGDCARPGGSPVVVLSHGLWQRRFSGDPSVVGRGITLNRVAFTVAGVAARGFGGTELRGPDVYLPIAMQPVLAPDRLADEDRSWLRLVGRLAPGATAERAQAALTAIGRRRDAAYEGRESTVVVYPATLMGGPEGRREALWGGIVATAVAVLIVLIACLNLMNLLLSRAPARRRNVRIRLSLGASRRRIVTQLLGESMVLAALGGAIGVALAYRAPALLQAAIGAGESQLMLTPDVRVLGYAALVSIGAALAFGLVPALEATRVDLASALRGDAVAAGAGGTRSAARLRHVIVGAQIAGSVLLLVVAALFVRGVRHARAIDPGYRVANVLLFRPDLEQQRYDAPRAAAFYRTLRSRVALLPGVEAAGLATFPPLGRSRSTGRFTYAGTGDEGLVDYTTVSGGLFETLGLEIVRGRAFSGDEPVGEVRPVVIGEAMARRFWPSSDPLGRTFQVGGNAYEVIGIARDTRYFSIDASARAFFFAAAQLDPAPPVADDTVASQPAGLTLVVRTSGAAGTMAEVLRIARAIDPAVVVSTESLADRLTGAIRPARMLALFAGLLGGLATLLAVIGVYGAVAYAVSQRRHEIGVRFALGAARRDIIRLVLRQGVVPLLGGLAVGVLLALGAAQLVRSMIFGISPLDPAAFTVVILLISAVALVAMMVPARRAATIDLAVTLRSD